MKKMIQQFWDSKETALAKRGHGTAHAHLSSSKGSKFPSPLARKDTNVLKILKSSIFNTAKKNFIFGKRCLIF